MGSPEPFTLYEPLDGDSPVMVEVPHAGLGLDPAAASYLAATPDQLARDADLYVDELFAGTPAAGATLLVAHTSRCLVDLNRAEDDLDGEAVRGGPSRPQPRGVIWRLTSRGLPLLAAPLPRTEYLRRLNRYHRPYHQLLHRRLTEKRARFGFAVLLSAHSMPTPRNHTAGAPPADLVPGARGATSAAAAWIDLVDATARSRGWLVRHDNPYRGGYSTGHYGRPAEHWHAVQIEIARRLYLDEESLARRPAGFSVVKAFARELVARCVAETRAS